LKQQVATNNKNNKHNENENDSKSTLTAFSPQQQSHMNAEQQATPLSWPQPVVPMLYNGTLYAEYLALKNAANPTFSSDNNNSTTIATTNIYVIDKHQFLNFFNFLLKERSIANPCSFKCRVWMDEEPPAHIARSMDAVLAHDYNLGNDYKTRTFTKFLYNNNSTLAKSPNNNNNNYHLLLQANIRNEADIMDPELGFTKAALQPATNFHTDITMSFHRNSTIWANYNFIKPSELLPTPLEHFSEDEMFNGACTFISNCVEFRMAIVRTIGRFIPMRNYGSCARNSVTLLTKTQTLAKCKIYLSIENNIYIDDYITEKFFEGYTIPSANTLMVYMGPKNINQIFSHYPKLLNTFINIHDYESAEHVGKMLQNLLKNNDEFKQRMLWRQPSNLEYHQMIMEAFDRHHRSFQNYVPCKLCAAVAEMKWARKTLHDLGLKPKLTTSGKVSRQEFEEFTTQLGGTTQQKQHDMQVLFKMAYEKLWNKDNIMSVWNDYSYSCFAKELCFRPSA